jgi:hypothetical protein
MKKYTINKKKKNKITWKNNQRYIWSAYVGDEAYKCKKIEPSMKLQLA